MDWGQDLRRLNTRDNIGLNNDAFPFECMTAQPSTRVLFCLAGRAYLRMPSSRGPKR